MHTQEQRQKAVELFLETGSYATVANTLGYGSRWSIERWVNDYKHQGFVKESRTKWPKFTEEQKRSAVGHYLSNGRNASATVRTLGYPSRALLDTWITELAPGARKPRKDRIEYSLEQKIETVATFCRRDTTAREAATELGADLVTLYNWRRELLGEKAGSIMSDIYDEQLPDDIEGLKEQKAVLERELYEAKLELALRKGAIEIVKKDPGADLDNLTNREKTILIDALRPEVPLNDLLACLNMAKNIPAGKVYLSPIIDCFDGMAVSWTIGTSPNAELVNTMLDNAIAKLKKGEHPVTHSDRGCHYRWPGWIERMRSADLIRSMSKKGCSPDNSACEGFFGRLKNEMFYNRSWHGVSIEEFIATLDSYIRWYNTTRIKQSLGYLSPVEYRQSLDLAA